MTRTTSPKKRAADKRSGPPKTVDEYIAQVPGPGRAALKKIRAAARAAAPAQATEVISYRMPALKYKQVLIWYAAFSEHCSLFPTAAVIDALRDELKPYIASKGTLQFPIGKPPSAALVKKIVKTRLAQIEAKS